jgi:hypothetical protein
MIIPVTNEAGVTHFRALAGATHSEGATAGQALDALTSKSPLTSRRTLVVIDLLRPEKKGNTNLR